MTAELRWFWRGEAPVGLEEWFRSELAAEGETRVDRYLRDSAELGIKVRGGGTGVELKGLVAKEVGRSATAPFRGPIQLWAKWTSEALRLEPRRLIAVKKTRWLRAFEGCNVELTRIKLSRGQVWWTLGFEAVGASELRRAAALLARRRPPRLTGGRLSSYPAWLALSERYRRT